MKSILKRGLALLLIVMIIVSSISISSFADVSRPQANTGIRDEVCTTFNGTTAPAYYTGTYSYANLSTLSASTLKSTLTTLMTSTHKNTSSYNNCRDYAPYTDCEGGDTSHFTMLYTSYSATYSQYNSGQGWNREHVWPQSLGGGNTSGGGADLHHIRPEEAKTNSTRSNRRYGNVTNGTAATGNLSGDIGGYYGGNDLYEPLDNVKGDVARICLYVYVRWGSSWGADNITDVFQSVDVLLEWCALDPVDTWEMERNDVVQGVQGNRNVFIDYPELAWMIFGKTVPSNLVSPSDGVENGTVSGGGNQGGGTTPDEPTTPDPTPDEPGAVTPTGTATITFATRDNRVSLSATSQVWSENGITLTNNKAASINDVADFVNPVRLYQDSEIIISSPNMTKIVIKCAGGYVEGSKTGLKNAGYTVSVDDTNITVVFDSLTSSVTYTASVQTRFNSIDVYYGTVDGGDEGGSAAPDEPVTPEPTPDPEPTPNPGEDIGGGNDQGGVVVTGSATIKFDSVSKRTSFSTAEQIWEENSIVFVNTKTSSSSPIADYCNPVRVYSGSKFSVSYSGMKKIVFTCSSASYAGVLSTTLGNAGYTAAVSGMNVTVEFDKTIDVINLTASAKLFISSIEVFYETVVPGGCEGGYHNKNEHGYCKDCEVSFRTASLVLSADLALRYGVEIIDAKLLELGDVMMVFTLDGRTYTVADFSVSGNYYVFAFDGISPDEMTMLITADFYIGAELVATFDNYSVEKNLLSVREKNSNDKTLVQLVNDVLIYGSAAQKYTNNNISDLAGADASNVVASTDVPGDEVLIDGNDNANLYIKSMGVHFDCVNYIYIKIYVSNPASFSKLVVEGDEYALSDMENLGDGFYRLNLSPVTPTSFGDLLLVTLVGADSVEYTTAIYSVNCYAGYMYNGGASAGSTMYDLALALYRYGNSAVAYAIAHA